MEEPLLNLPIGRNLNLLRDRINSFWAVWRKDYLNQLQNRNKWPKITKNLKVGQIVADRKEVSKLCNWLLGKIEKTFPGKDGRVRVVDIWFASSIKRRPVTELVLLPCANELSGGRMFTSLALPMECRLRNQKGNIKFTFRLVFSFLFLIIVLR